VNGKPRLTPTGRYFPAVLSVFALVLALPIGGCLLGGGGGPTNSQPYSGQTPPTQIASRAGTLSTPIVDRLPRSLRLAFAVFRSPPEGLPTSMTQVLRKPVHGSNWSLAQRLLATPVPVWAVPANGFLCLLIQRHSNGPVEESCMTALRSIMDGIFIASIRDSTGRATRRRRIVVGLVPDRTYRVRIETSGVPTMTEPVIDNVFRLRDTAVIPPDEVTLLRRSPPAGLPGREH
jgi:hypothetical protein